MVVAVQCIYALYWAGGVPSEHGIYGAGTPAKTAGWMNVLPDMSAAPVVSKDAQAANDGKVQP